jgi:hypothetical protein
MTLKLFIIKNNLNFSILLFIIMFSILHYIKPALVYNKKGDFREFGVGYKNKTVLPIWIFAIILAIISYLLVSYYILFC